MSAPVARPQPVSPSIAQGVIAALTFFHAGVIGYAIKQEVDAKSEALIVNGVRAYINCDCHAHKHQQTHMRLNQNGPDHPPSRERLRGTRQRHTVMINDAASEIMLAVSFTLL